ncbi:hypothetical protein ACH5RR_015445, partial [Cinchona calisaya]
MKMKTNLPSSEINGLGDGYGGISALERFFFLVYDCEYGLAVTLLPLWLNFLPFWTFFLASGGNWNFFRRRRSSDNR